jgi:Transport and Golgi organisation 2
VCTVLLRFAPGTRWPLLLAAVRDEFADRPWDPPDRYWDGRAGRLVGGRDRVAGGTWLAVDRQEPAVAAVLNGAPLAVPVGAVRHSRGGLPLAALTVGGEPDTAGYDRFHLLRAGVDRVEVWRWDGTELRHQKLDPGEHIVVNSGVDVPDDPLVPHFLPLLRSAADPDPRPGVLPGQAWGDWLRLLGGDGLDPTDPRALIVRRPVGERTFASTSASLIALGRDGVRYDFAADPGPVARWQEVR